jgi:PAS domain S-box-containing protein
VATCRLNGERKRAEENLQKTKGELELRIQIRSEDAAHAIQALRESEARFRGLLECAPDAIVIVNSDGLITLVNDQADKLFGYPRQELLNQPAEMLMPERFRKNHAIYRANYSSDPQARPMGIGLELAALRRDGKEFPVEVALSPFHTEAGLWVISIIRDVTERKMAQQALAQKAEEMARSNVELERFAYVASHDLQEPLRMVSSYTQLLARRYKGKLDLRADTYIGFAVDGANRMQKLINDLLAYSRVGTRSKEFAQSDCGQVLTQALANLRVAIQESGAAVTSGPLPIVVADEVQLVQLFQNVISNAIKFRGDKRPVVHVSAKHNGDEWVFSIRDNGIGIDPEYFDRIFVVFQRLHGPADIPGTGIGLAIAKKIVERHGGRIWVESQPGEGSTFHFTLPASSGARVKAKEGGL